MSGTVVLLVFGLIALTMTIGVPIGIAVGVSTAVTMYLTSNVPLIPSVRTLLPRSILFRCWRCLYSFFQETL